MPTVFNLPQIIAQLQTSWGGDREGHYYKWLMTNVDYSMPNITPFGEFDEENGFQPLGTTQRALASEAFELWDDLIAINLNETATVDSKITFAYTNTMHNNDSAYGTPEFAGSSAIKDVEVWMNANTSYLEDARIAISRYGFFTYLHEIGHALGLTHPGSYDVDASGEVPEFKTDAEFAQDNRQYTVMSYFGAYNTFEDKWFQDGSNPGQVWANPSTPMLYDIAAIQSKYGADMTTRTGDTTYGDNSNAGRAVYDFSQYPNAIVPNPIFAIWDAGGIDTLDTSSAVDNQRIFLQEGMYSDVKGLKANIAIAYGVTIENAIGGSGSDAINGNAAVNKLEGRSGNDYLDGREGADIMIGGVGNDTYFVDQGPLFILNGYRPGDEVFENANEGIDTVESYITYMLPNAVENLNLIGASALDGYGNALDNVMRGNSGANRLDGYAGKDTLDGAAGADIMIGGVGNDTYFVDQGPLFILNGYRPGDEVFENANEGIDTVQSSITYELGVNVEKLILTGADALWGTGNALSNVIVGNDANNVINGRAGPDTLRGNGGNDAFVFNLGQANGDTIIDFAGLGAAAGDSLTFVGYGAGATFTRVDATHWQINAGASHEVITFNNAASLDPSDYMFL